jgi:hypothetical protein
MTKSAATQRIRHLHVYSTRHLPTAEKSIAIATRGGFSQNVVVHMTVLILHHGVAWRNLNISQRSRQDRRDHLPECGPDKAMPPYGQQRMFDFLPQTLTYWAKKNGADFRQRRFRSALVST